MCESDYKAIYMELSEKRKALQKVEEVRIPKTEFKTGDRVSQDRVTRLSKLKRTDSDSAMRSSE